MQKPPLKSVIVFYLLLLNGSKFMGTAIGYVFMRTDWNRPVPVEKLKEDLKKISINIDHSHLNDKIPDGTMESIAIWFAKQFEATEYQVKKVSVCRKSMGIGVDYVLD